MLSFDLAELYQVETRVLIQAIKRSAKSNWGVNELMQNEINDEVDAYQKFYGHEFGTASKHKESIIELALEEQTWQDKLAVLREETVAFLELQNIHADEVPRPTINRSSWNQRI